jgi:hypothetical protein
MRHKWNGRGRAAIISTAVPGIGLAALIACGESPTRSGPGTGEPVTPRVTSASLVSGGDGVLVGTGLDRLASTLTVDGVPVTVTARSGSEIRFGMPAPRGCEVDGRPVRVVAGDVSHSGILTVPTVIRLQAGESRVLAVADLAGLCIQLPAGSEEYVLSSVNRSLDDRSGRVDTMFTVQVLTAGGGDHLAAAVGAPPAQAAGPWTEVAPLPPPAQPGVRLAMYAASPEPFDLRYATAGPGETVRWVDYAAPAAFRAGFCELPKDSVPTYPVVVAAVSSSGRMVIGIDARNPRLQEWMRPDQRALLTQIAEISDRYALPAVREVMNRDHAPAAGAGGRWWHIFSSAAAGFTLDGAGRPQQACKWNSEVATTLGPDVPLTGESQVRAVSALLVHEYAHQADQVEQIRRFGTVQTAVPGWLTEAWAQSAPETAARIASAQPTAARFDRLGADAPLPDFYVSAWGVRPEPSPWRAAAPYPRGAYEQGARLLLYLRERWGDAALGSQRPRFYQRVMEVGRFDAASLANLVGTDAETLLDRWALAEAADDLIDPAVVIARDLPQLATWAPPGEGGGRAISRAQDTAVPFFAGRGNYVAWYLPARFADASPGASLTFENVRPGPYLIRLTRLR